METKELTAQEVVLTTPEHGFKYGDPIDFNFDGKRLTGIVDSATGGNMLSAVYAYGNTWGTLILTAANAPSAATDAAAAMCSGLNYCTAELDSLRYSTDDVAELVRRDVQRLQEYLLVVAA